MGLGPEDYREGARRRIDDAWSLFDQERWEGAVYLAGRAAQAMLRGLLARQRGELQVGHDLREHLRQVRGLGILKLNEDDELEDAINDLAVLWRNDLRFTGARRFRQLLKQAGRLERIGRKRISGDPEKPNARGLLNAAEAVVSRGNLIWQRLNRN